METETIETLTLKVINLIEEVAELHNLRANELELQSSLDSLAPGMEELHNQISDEWCHYGYLWDRGHITTKEFNEWLCETYEKLDN